MQHFKTSPFHVQRSSTPNKPTWSLPQCAGRLIECAGGKAGASLSAACHLVYQAQVQGEPAAWITLRDSVFFPPDLDAFGIHLDALPVVRVLRPKQLVRAADILIRTGAFGLVVVDLPPKADIGLHVQSRLAGLARHHQSAVAILTHKEEEHRSLGSMISLRIQTLRGHGLHAYSSQGERRFACNVKALKDKKNGATWQHTQGCNGPAGLR